MPAPKLPPLPPNAPAADLSQAVRAALDASNAAIAISDAQRHLVYVNDGFVRMFGWSKEELLGQPAHEFLIGPHSEPGLLTQVRAELAQGLSTQREALLHTRYGDPVWVSLHINRCPWLPGMADGTISVHTELSAPLLHERLQQRVLEAMVQERSLPELMRLICVEVERISPEVTASVLAVNPDGVVQPLAAPGLPASVCEGLEGLRIGPCAGSCGTAAYTGQDVVVTDIATSPLWDDFRALYQPTGLRACWSNPIKDHDGHVVGAFAFYYRTPRGPSALHRKLVDVCLHLCTLAFERDANRKRLHQLAYYDSLTGLPNRVQFRASAQMRLDTLRQHRSTAALMLLDLDRFKQVNDTQGHAAGDALLREIAYRLGQCTGPHDVVARLASDEFAVLLAPCDQHMALAAAQRVLDGIAKPYALAGHTLVPSAGMGLAMYPVDGDNIDTLLRHADQAMAYARSERPHSAAWFSSDMSQRAQERMTLEQALRTALATPGELQLHYQPQVHMGEPPSLHGLEALMRWTHPQRGAISPAIFIPIAEESGLIHPLTQWLLDESCRQLQAWRQAGLRIPNIAINLSGRSFAQPDLAPQIMQALQHHGLGCNDLQLEITESVMMDARPVTMTNIDQLHALGLRLSLDDFGTGYSSLSYLHRLPIAELKLDRSFVHGLPHSNTAQALTTSVLTIAQSLGMAVVAEGVETPEQQTWLTEHGCPVLQGYLLAHPLPADAVPAWLHDQAMA